MIYFHRCKRPMAECQKCSTLGHMLNILHDQVGSKEATFPDELPRLSKTNANGGTWPN